VLSPIAHARQDASPARSTLRQFRRFSILAAFSESTGLHSGSSARARRRSALACVFPDRIGNARRTEEGSIWVTGSEGTLTEIGAGG